MGNDAQNPRGPQRLAHQFQAFAGPPRVIFPPALQIYPDTLRGKAKLAHLIPFFTKPVQARPPLYHPPIFPDVLRGKPKIAHRFQSFARPAVLAFGYVAGYGEAGAATFLLSLEPGAKLTLTWRTDIFKSHSGNEQRSNTSGPLPLQRIEGTAFLRDTQTRDVQGALQAAAASGATFLLALPYEEIELSANAVGTTYFVESTAQLDWAVVTQRVMVLGVDGVTSVQGVIQQVTATSIRLDVSSALGGLAGGRMMPLIQVVLDAAQGFARYAVNVSLWAIRAKSRVFGWIATDSIGRGAQVTTYTVGGPVDVDDLNEEDLLIWDRGNDLVDTGAESMMSLTEVVDLGGVPLSVGAAPVPDWARQIQFRSSDPDDWQWLKAFLRQVRGRQKAFAMSTSRNDLTYVATTSGGIKVRSDMVSGFGDYESWYVSLAHRRLAITGVDGSIQYVTVRSLVNNGDGTLTLATDNPVTGTPIMVSLLEQLRFDNNDSDDFPVTWDGYTFSVDLLARAAQETLTPPSLGMFDTVVTISLPSDGLHHVPDLELGTITLVNVVVGTGGTMAGINPINGTGPVHGQVICLLNVSNQYSCIDEDTVAPAALRFKSRALASSVGGGFWYRYDSNFSRWVRILSTL